MDNQDNNQPKEQVVTSQSAEVQSVVQAIAGSAHKKPVFAMSPTAEEILEKAGYSKTDPQSPLMYAIGMASGSAKSKAPALAFTENPVPSDNWLGLYKTKRRLIPDSILKEIRINDHLVAAILRARGNMMSMFAHLPKDRFDNGIQLTIKPEFFKVLTPEQHEKVVERMKQVEKILLNCGHTEGLEQHEQMTLADWMDQQVRNGLTFGRFADEIIYDRSKIYGGKPKFHRWRPVDVGTICKVLRHGEGVAKGTRENALKQLGNLLGEQYNIDFKSLEEDKYAWAQVIDNQSGAPRQYFTDEEMIVYNLFPSTDIEHNGYPVTPIDTSISSITTHISIDAYKKLYFQNGRATRGILVIQSDEVDEAMLNGVKAQFSASVNNVTNSFRTPIFGVSTSDNVEWVPMAGEGAQDHDFQFMYDQVARNILSAFSISPDEMPGYAHLSRGTNSQTLSESNNEFKLTAARDTGLRPLLLKFQTYFNQRLFPLIDPLLSQVCEIRLVGLDAQSKEQESTRLQQDMPTHMTYDEVLHEVDKDPIGVALGGKFPFNERWQLIADKYLDVGFIKAKFFNDPAALVDPLLKFKRDPFALQNLQLLAQVNPIAVQAMFAPKPFAIDFLKMEIQDQLEADEENE